MRERECKGLETIKSLHLDKDIKYENQVSSYISVWSCGFSSAKLVH